MNKVLKSNAISKKIFEKAFDTNSLCYALVLIRVISVYCFV